MTDDMMNQRSLVEKGADAELRIPTLSTGSYFPSFLEPRRMAEKALTARLNPALWLQTAHYVVT